MKISQQLILSISMAKVYPLTGKIPVLVFVSMQTNY